MQESLRIALKIEYSGGKFCGSQLQLGARTVQLELEKALNIYFRTGQERAIKATFCGRTDSGVHALGQVVHFDLDNAFICRAQVAGSWGTLFAGSNNEVSFSSLDAVSMKNMCWALNGILPDDVSVSQAQIVPSTFNARFSARRRTYVYRILNRAQRSALRHRIQHFLKDELDLDAMKSASQSLIGLNDFSSFKSSNKEKVNPVCLVERAEILNKGEGELEFWICADHFVYNMVRIIVGTLLEVGLGKRAPSALSEALAGKDRHLAGPTAPPWGLCLYSVDYPVEYSLFQKDS